jgi:hypothetical protein
MSGKRRQNFKISNTSAHTAQYVANIPCRCCTFLRRESLTFGWGKSFGLFFNVPYPKYPFSFLCVAFRGMNAWVSRSQQRAREFIVDALTGVGLKKDIFFSGLLIIIIYSSFKSWQVAVMSPTRYPLTNHSPERHQLLGWQTGPCCQWIQSLRYRHHNPWI